MCPMGENMTNRPQLSVADENRRINDVLAAFEHAAGSVLACNRPTVEVGQNGVRLSHIHLIGTFYMTRGLPLHEAHDGSAITRAGIRFISNALDDVARRHARAQDLQRAGIAYPAHDYQGVPDSAPPPWSILVHPIYAYAIAKQTRGRMDVQPGGIFGTRLSHDLGMGSIWIKDPATELDPLTSIKAQATLLGGAIMLHKALSPSIAQALRGRPFTDAVAVPPSGISEIDEAIARLIIWHVGVIPRFPSGALPETRIRCAPDRWLPLSPPPPGVVRTFDTLHPFVR